MLKKLRRRFILAAMAAFGAVMLLLTAGINVLNYYQVAKSQDHTIEGIHEYTQFHVPAPDHALPPISQMPWANSEEADYTIRFFILTLNTDTVTALSWEYNEETLAFHKEESWLYDEDENFPVDPEKISSFLEQFQEFGVSFIIEDVEDYGQYGLDEPLCTIHITTEEQEYEIQLGNYSNMDSERYVSIGDGNSSPAPNPIRLYTKRTAQTPTAPMTFTLRTASRLTQTA